MSFQVNQGLAKQFDCSDYHAILGMPIGSSAADIRKRFLKIARSLHPDSRQEESNKQLASQFLSKLVNPAYEIFSQDKQRTEYEALLRIMGQQLGQQRESVQPVSDLARQLLNAPDVEGFYRQAVQKLAEDQYQSLDQVISVTGELSDLNLVYLLRRETGGTTPAPAVAVSSAVSAASGYATSSSSAGMGSGLSTPTVAADSAKSASGAAPGGSPSAPGSSKESYANQYCRRAEELIAKNCFPQAVTELRDGLKIAPQSSRCHSLLGTTYLKMNQVTMAKVHINQALKLNAGDVDALKARDKIARIEQKQKAKAAQATPAKPESRGLFGLFGGSKKK
jgi:curved DNA-binding protein CbpA